MSDAKSRIRIVATSEQLDVDQVTAHVVEERHYGHSKGGPMCPMGPHDRSHMIAPLTVASWSRYFNGDGSEVLTDMIRGFTDDWDLLKQQASETDIRWKLAIVFHLSAKGDCVVFDVETTKHFADLNGTIDVSTST